MAFVASFMMFVGILLSVLPTTDCMALSVHNVKIKRQLAAFGRSEEDRRVAQLLDDNEGAAAFSLMQDEAVVTNDEEDEAVVTDDQMSEFSAMLNLGADPAESQTPLQIGTNVTPTSKPNSTNAQAHGKGSNKKYRDKMTRNNAAAALGLKQEEQTGKHNSNKHDDILRNTVAVASALGNTHSKKLQVPHGNTSNTVALKNNSMEASDDWLHQLVANAIANGTHGGSKKKKRKPFQMRHKKTTNQSTSVPHVNASDFALKTNSENASVGSTMLVEANETLAGTNNRKHMRRKKKANQVHSYTRVKWSSIVNRTATAGLKRSHDEDSDTHEMSWAALVNQTATAALVANLADASAYGTGLYSTMQTAEVALQNFTATAYEKFNGQSTTGICVLTLLLLLCTSFIILLVVLNFDPESTEAEQRQSRRGDVTATATVGNCWGLGRFGGSLSGSRLPAPRMCPPFYNRTNAGLVTSSSPSRRQGTSTSSPKTVEYLQAPPNKDSQSSNGDRKSGFPQNPVQTTPPLLSKTLNLPEGDLTFNVDMDNLEHGRPFEVVETKSRTRIPINFSKDAAIGRSIASVCSLSGVVLGSITSAPALGKPMAINASNNVPYGQLRVIGDMVFALSYMGRDILIVKIYAGMFTVDSATSGEKLCTASVQEGQTRQKDQLSCRLQPGADVVLVLLSIVGVLVFCSREHDSAPSLSPKPILSSPGNFY